MNNIINLHVVSSRRLLQTYLELNLIKLFSLDLSLSKQELHWDYRNLFSISIVAIKDQPFQRVKFPFQSNAWSSKLFLRPMSSSRSLTFSTEMSTWTKALSIVVRSQPKATPPFLEECFKWTFVWVLNFGVS